MAAGPRERLAALIKDLEKAARQLRADVRKRASTAPKSLDAAVSRLRKGVTEVTRQVEKYVHDLRVGLEGKKPAAKRTTRRKPARRRARSA